MTTTLTPEQFHSQLREQFAKFERDVREGKVEPYTFLADQGVNYNAWLEHRHVWPVGEDGECLPSTGSTCCEEHEPYVLDAEDCSTCTKLIEMYEEAKSK